MFSHRVEVSCEHAQLIAAPREFLADARLQIAGREGASARLQSFDRLAHVTRKRPADKAADDQREGKQQQSNIGAAQDAERPARGFDHDRVHRIIVVHELRREQQRIGLTIARHALGEQAGRSRRCA